MKASNRVVILGGGAAGLSAALFALRGGADVTLLEQNEKIGKKLYITGKGRCNLTNDCDTEEFLRSVPRNPRFLYAALRFLSPQALRALLLELGCDTKVERGRRVFPVSDHASDVSRAFLGALRGADIRLNATALALEVSNGRVTGVRARGARGEYTLPADCVIIATGGLSYPATGSTGDGLRLAREAGHTVEPTAPALVPLTARDAWVKQLQGLTLKNVCLSAHVHGKMAFGEMGELLFTHFGLSGPLALTLSSVLAGGDWAQADIRLDCKPALSPEQLDLRLTREFAAAPRRRLQSVMGALLPARMAALLPALCGVDGNRQCAQVTQSERARIAGALKSLPLHITGARPLDEAVVTRGGVRVGEVSPSTLMSRRVEGLYFAGEVLDIDAFTGGFNLHIAFSTGALAGHSAALRAAGQAAPTHSSAQIPEG